MSDFDKDMQEALGGGGGFDPSRTHSAQAEVYREYQKKMKWFERGMWSALCLFNAAGIYALWGFILQATTTKEWIGYGMAIMWAFVFTIQINILMAITFSRLMTMKEIKQLRLAMAGEAIAPNEAAAKPLRGISRRERAAWVCGMIAAVGLAGVLGARTDSQDDLWRLKAHGRIEAHSALTLNRFPHDVHSINGIKEPAAGATLQSATLNGRPVPFSVQATDPQTNRPVYMVQLPYKFSWTTDRVELVWGFSLPAMKDYLAVRAPLHSLMPVHYYSLTLYVEDDSGFMGEGDAWKFIKTPKELKNETEARRTLKCFTGGVPSSGPQNDFGTCGLPIVARPGR